MFGFIYKKNILFYNHQLIGYLLIKTVWIKVYFKRGSLTLGMQISKKTLVLGASDNPTRYSFMAITRLRQQGHLVVAIGKKETKISDINVATGFPLLDNIDTVTLYLNPQNQKVFYDYIISLNPKRIIFNPGTENTEFAKMAAAHGVYTMEACTLVLLSTNQY